MARAAAVDLRSTARPTAADAVVVLADWTEQLHAALSEVLGIFDGLTANMPEEFQILERAKAVVAATEYPKHLVTVEHRTAVEGKPRD
jgi:hypothetical protein